MSVVHRTVRRIQNAAGDCPRLTKFYLKAPKSVEIEFDNGSAFSLPAEYLRIYSPAADSKIRSVGGEKVIYGRRHVGIMSAEPVGNYGVSSRALSKATQKMAATSAVLKKTHKALWYSLTTRTAVASNLRRFSGVSATATAGDPQSQEDDDPSSLAFTFSSEQDPIFVKGISKNNNLIAQPDSVSMPMSFMTGSIVGKRFYQKVTAREADDGNGWTVMLDYRTLKTPAKRPLKCPTPTLAMAIAAEWDYQQTDGIRPFTMPLMKLACTALERVPLTRPKIIEHLTKKFHQDLVFCRAPGDNDLTKCVLDRQVEKIDPLLNWLEKEFGHKPVVYSSFFGGKQGEGLVAAIEALLRGMDDCELASIDAIASAAHSLVIAIAMFRGRLGIEEAIELIRLEEDLQVDRWGLVEGGHDIDIADLRVQISSASVFLGLSRRN